MKRLLLCILIGLLFRLVGAQDVEYKLNPRTGKFDMVRSSEWAERLGGDAAFDGNRQITRTGIPNVIPGGATVTEFLENFFYPKRNPTATVTTTPTTREYMGTGADLQVALNYTVGRPATCPAITSVTVAGVTQGIPAIAEGGTYNRSQQSLLQRNVDKTFTINVQAGANSATASITVVWRWMRYWGAFVSAVPPTDPSFTVTSAQILALSNNEFATARQKVFSVNPAGNYIAYTCPKVWGAPNVYVNGFAFNDYTVKEINFTNASGGNTTYYFIILNQKYYSSIDVEVK
jgi:hypothetical protein